MKNKFECAVVIGLVYMGAIQVGFVAGTAFSKLVNKIQDKIIQKKEEP